MNQSIRLMHIDPCMLIQRGLKSMIEERSNFSICEQSSQPLELFQLWSLHQPDVTLLEISGCGPAIFRCIRKLTCHYPSAVILILSTSNDEVDVSRSFQAGVRGYLLKTSCPTELLKAISSVIDGGRYICEQLPSPLSRHNEAKQLSPREKEVLRLVSLGSQNKNIANDLCISECTVKTHMTNIFTKLNAISRTEAVSIGLRLGIVRFS